MNRIKKIVVHCSASKYGSALLIDGWHKARGWKGIGYHFVILNGYPYSSRNQGYWEFLDGMVESGRPLDADPWLEAEEVGAHAYGYNRESVGICLIGKPDKGVTNPFSHRQLISVRAVILALMHEFNLSPIDVLGHCELDPQKICPGLNMQHFREYLRDASKLDDLI